ncbi:YhgE/Pip family protein [Mycobacterium sp. SMC-4]|uniref:YhgE/Pip family protein n=1 Tax=Mycobacterium sp. SMC-4 TaxID=2857059 RepID=UPI003D04264B
MVAGLPVGTDLKSYARGVMPRVAVVTIILMPLLYGAMYLWAFWNPFAEIDKIPVALVNQDRGIQAQGQSVRAGDEVATALRDSGQLNLTEMSAQDAAAGVADGRYYFSITLPENFSERIASPSGPDPEQAQLRFTFNEANNYLASIIGQNAAREILNQINAEVGERAIGTVVSGLTDAGQGLDQAADGAQQLASGLTTANDGAHQLSTGATALSAGLRTAQSGSAQLAAGTQQLSGAVDKATGPLLDVLDRVGELNINPDDVAVTAQHLSGAVRSTTDRIAALNINSAQAAAVIDQAVAFLENNPDPTIRDAGRALAGAQRLLRAEGIDPATDDGLIRLRDSAARLENELGDPNSQLRVFLTNAINGGLRADVAQLRDGVDELNTGAHQLDDGLRQLNAGGDRIADGAAELADGTQRLEAGGQELATRLRQGSTLVPDWSPQQRTEVARTLAAPVGLDLVTENPAATFGTGFAPFFLPLALFIGALIIWMLLKPLRSRPVMAGLGAVRVVLASYWPGLLIAVCQVVVMYAVVHFGVGLQAKYPLATVGFLILVAGTFLALIQAFNALFGEAIGRVVTLAFLMLQLVSAGGIYPVETTAKPFQIIHPFDPMTYAVNGLRHLIVGGIDARLWTAIAVLTGVLVVSLAASAWAARRNRQYTMDRLHPPIEV